MEHTDLSDGGTDGKEKKGKMAFCRNVYDDDLSACAILGGGRKTSFRSKL